jgi:TPR repeat protein
MTFHSRHKTRRAGPIVAAWVAVIVVVTSPSADAQGDRETALAALRSAAIAGGVEAQLALGSLLDQGQAERDDEALRWYEAAARAGSKVAQQRYLAMMAKPPRKASAASAGFMVRLPRNGMQGDIDGPPPDLPPGYHCHALGRGQMWCHGGTDPTQ